MVERQGAVEAMVVDRTFWRGRRVFLTGHTGFKGSWTSLVLSALGAEVYGFALAPENEADLFQVAQIEGHVHHHLADIRDLSALGAALAAARPQVVIHMAAQSLLPLSYAEPVTTFSTNVMGTMNLLEAIRHVPGIEAAVMVTSDKCYTNNAWVWGYRETDRLGGPDPYSSSKACAELVVEAYRRSFFSGEAATKIATARAGNVIGGGDWSRDRLVPDAMRAFLAGATLLIRNARATRPWQHVLDPVQGYLALAQHLVQDGNQFAEAWNFGPSSASEVTVKSVVEALSERWGRGASWRLDDAQHPHEETYLKLDSSKAARRLGWETGIDIDEALRLTVDWYLAYGQGADMRSVTLAQIDAMLGAQASLEIESGGARQ